MAVTKHICVHGHFYQPPRENPWLEVVEAQDSAAPFHDWNERVAAECYAPNSAARILGRHGAIADIVNNYQNISFNFGPTLLSWMQQERPGVYQAILEADRASLARLGHGNALAQVYNHVIMPLASRRDKATQVRWGVRDFVQRYGRRPEGMWLAEAAVDLESLRLLAAEGIRYTILSPGQCARVRPGPDSPWCDVHGGRVDPRQAYRVALPGGGQIAVFFYDGPASRAVAFERLLDDGNSLAARIKGLFDPKPAEPQLVSLATDGESYGHHHRFGEMALAWALRVLEQDREVALTNYATFLEAHPPTWEAQIIENSSWSCAHGVERWQSDCGCGNLDRPGWNQKWREPLRAGLDALKTRLDHLFETLGGSLLKDPWAARDEYVELIGDRSHEAREDFLGRHQKAPLDQAGRVKVRKLLESQRYGMYMFTSCGWFFDDLAGIEPVQNLRYAGRALQLAQGLDGGRWEDELLAILSEARSNHLEEGNGADIWRRQVAPAAVGPRRVAAHAVINCVLGEEPPPAELHSYRLETLAYSHRHNMGLHLAWGRLRLWHNRVGERHELAFAALHTGGHDFKALVLPASEAQDLSELGTLVEQPLRLLETYAIWQILERHLGGAPYTMADLFLEGRRELAQAMLERTMTTYREAAHALYEAHRDTMLFLHEINVPLPPAFTALAEIILADEVAKGLAEEPAMNEFLGEVALQARALGLALNQPGLRRVMERVLTKDLLDLCESPGPGPVLERAAQVLDLAAALKVEVDLWAAQNRFHQLLQERGPEGLPPELTALGRRLNFDVG